MNPHSASTLFVYPGYQKGNRQKVDKTSNLLFLIQTLSGMMDDLQSCDAPIQIDRPAALWIERGLGSIKIDLEHYLINDNMLVCLSQDQLLSIETNDNVKGYYISFSPEFLLAAEGQTGNSLLDAFYQRQVLPVAFPDAEARNEINQVVTMLSREYNSYGLLRPQIVKGLLKVFLVYLSGNIQTSEPEEQNDREAEMVRRFMELVKKHFLSKKMVADYARELCVSPNYLNRIVKKISGYTASYYIQQQIILEAKRQAMYSRLSMKEVAYSLGFNDYAHFSKFFKNNSGINFTSFKNQVNKRA